MAKAGTSSARPRVILVARVTDGVMGMLRCTGFSPGGAGHRFGGAIISQLRSRPFLDRGGPGGRGTGRRGERPPRFGEELGPELAGRRGEGGLVAAGAAGRQAHLAR